MITHQIIFILIALLIQSACQSMQKTSSPSSPISPLRPQELFPYGLQNHNVTLKMGKKQFSFRGILQRNPCRMTIVGLSPSSSTLFHFDENLMTGEIQWETYEKNLKKHVDKLPEILQILKPVFFLPIRPQLGPIQSKSCPQNHTDTTSDNTPLLEIDEITTASNGLPARVTFKKGSQHYYLFIRRYDDLTVPISFQMVHPRFEWDIQVESYQVRDEKFGMEP